MKPVGFPTVVILGLAVERIGRSSVVWRIGLWSTRSDYSTHESDHQTIVDTRDDEIGCHAFGNFVHVFVDHSFRQKIEISPLVRAGASRLLVDKQ
jgi:acyl-CoA thioesterase FadM